MKSLQAVFMTPYQWINIKEITGIKEKQIIIFGAGKGTEEFLTYLKEADLNVRVQAIVDNDETYWDCDLCGYKIISPERINDVPFHKVVVTSISGRDSIAFQLENMGFNYSDDYILIGRYPRNYAKNYYQFMDVMKSLEPSFSIQDTQCLHIGPGGFLGLEILLYCFGAEHIVSFDKYAFALHYPELTQSREDYIQIKEYVKLYALNDLIRKEAFRRLEEIFIFKEEHLFLNQNNIEYIYPMDLCNIMLEDERFDIVLSFAVLEHVNDPETAVKNTARVLKPGGFGFHTIVTRDHRSFSSVSGYDPFSFRCHSREEWERINEKKFYQNRLLPIEWKTLFHKSGMRIVEYSTNHILKDENVFSTFHPDFDKFSTLELSEIDCTIVAQKNESFMGQASSSEKVNHI